MPGNYTFTDDACSAEGSAAALCIDRDVTIEAIPGSVVLHAGAHAFSGRRMLYLHGSADVELIGLEVTGGQVEPYSIVSTPTMSQPHTILSAALA